MKAIIISLIAAVMFLIINSVVFLYTGDWWLAISQTCQFMILWGVRIVGSLLVGGTVTFFFCYLHDLWHHYYVWLPALKRGDKDLPVGLFGKR